MLRFFPLLGVLLLACGESPTPAEGGSAGAAGSGTAGSAGEAETAGSSGASGAGGAGGASGASGAAGVFCEPEPGGVCVQEVRGRVQDNQGTSLSSKVVTVCGSGCFVGKTGSKGEFSVLIDALLKPEEYALSVHGRPDHGSTYLRLPSLGSIIEFPEAVELPLLPAGGPSLPEDGGPATSISSGTVTLDVAEGTSFDLDIDDIALGEEGRRLRVAEVEPARATFVQGAAQVFVMAPFGAKLSRPAGVRIANSAGLPEGQAVELVIMEDDLLADAGNLAGLPRTVAKGRVQGGVIQSEPGQGLDKITWLAVLAK